MHKSKNKQCNSSCRAVSADFSTFIYSSGFFLINLLSFLAMKESIESYKAGLPCTFSLNLVSYSNYITNQISVYIYEMSSQDPPF